MAKRIEARYIDMLSRTDIPSRDEVPLSANIAIVMQHWKTMASTTVAVLALGLGYAYVGTPTYRADAMIQVEDPNVSTTGESQWKARDPVTPYDASAAAATEAALVKSRLVIEQAVDALHLDIVAAPKYFPVLGRVIARYSKSGELAKPLLGMKSFAWGGASIEASRFDAPYDTPFTLRAGANGAYELLDEDGAVVARGVAGQLATGVSGGRGVSLLVDKLVANPGTEFTIKRIPKLDAITRLQDTLAVEAQGKDAGILSVSLEGEDSGKITRIVNEVSRVYVQQNIDHKKAETQTTLAFLNDQLPKVKAKLEDAESAYNAFRNKNGTIDLNEESRLLLGQIVTAQTEQTQLEERRNDLSKRFSDEAPQMAGLNQSIAQLQAQQQKFAQRIAQLPGVEQNALRLMRDVRVDTELYTNLLNNAQQLNIVRAGEVGNVRVVDWAMPPVKPVKPKKVIIAGLSLILGLMLGAALPFVRRRIRPGVEHTDQFEELLGVPVFSVVPHSNLQAKLERRLRRGVDGRHLLATQAPDDIAIEAIRNVQAALHFDGSEANNVILLTGPCPEVGKSFLAANLATVLAASGKRVLLVDADMRAGDIHAYFNVRANPGLAEVLAAGDALDGVRIREVAPGLDFVPKGSKPGNPAELLMSESFKRLMKECSAEYDVVLIDAPPLLAVTDATVIAKYAGTTLFAVRHGRHTVAELTEAERRLRNVKAEVGGVLLTDVPQGRLSYGTYYPG